MQILSLASGWLLRDRQSQPPLSAARKLAASGGGATRPLSINRCSWCDVRFRSASHWSSGNTRVRAKRHVSTLGKRLNRAFGVEDDDKIGHLRTNLRPPTRATGTDE